MSRRRHHWFSSLAVLALSLGCLPSARADGPAAPVLWDGVLRTPDGQPAAGDVIAFVRPPAAQLQPGHQLTEVTRTKANGSGRYVLRALPSEAFRAAQDPSGWVNVMVFAFSEKGISLATDAVAWRADDGFHGQSADSPHGRWVTSPAELMAPAGRFHAAEASSVAESERPSALVLSEQAPATVRAMGVRQGTPPAGYSCGLVRSKDMGIHPVAVGELHLGDAWGGLFDYTNTKTTSFQTGISYGGRGWQFGGSDSMTATRVMGQEAPIRAEERDDAVLATYSAELLFKRFDWRCSKNGLAWEDISTLQPVSWPNGGMQERRGGDPPRCGSNRRFFGTVTRNGTLTRSGGSSITLDRAISVAGFVGSMTSTVADNVRYQWHNGRDFQRAVCGSTGTLDQNTRVATSGMY